jgi:hypothetical protein
MFIYSIVFFCPSICNKCVIYSIYTHSNIYTFSILSGAHPSHRKHLAIERTNHTTTWQASWALNEMNMHIFIYVQLCTFISQSMFLDLLIFVSYIFPVENPLLGESAGNVFHFWWFSKQTQVFWPSQDTKDIIIQSSHGWLSATTLFLRVFFRRCAGECESLLPILGGRYQEDGLGKGPRWLSWWSLDDLQPPWWISEKGGVPFRGPKKGVHWVHINTFPQLGLG